MKLLVEPSECGTRRPPTIFKIGWIVSLVLLSTSVVLVSQTSNSEIQSITSALHIHDFDRALQLSRSALSKNPNNAQLWTMQGIALRGKADDKNALAAFRQALKISPDYVAALAGAAEIQYQAGDPKAIPLLNRLLRLRPRDPTSHAMLAVLQYREGNCEAAITHFQQAGTLLDSEIEAQEAYGTCLVRLQRFEEAAFVFKKGLALRPEDVRQRQLLASVQIAAKMPQESLATLQPLIKDTQASPAALELASIAYEDLGDTPNAVAALKQAILLRPADVNLYLDFASICLDHQSFQVGIDVIGDGMRLQPKAALLYLARGVLYVQLAQYENAEADFERAHELDPNQSLSSAAQGLAAAQQNDLDGALAAVEAKLARKPNDPYLLYLKADFLTQKSSDAGTAEFESAMSSAKKAVALQPSLAAARSVLAKLYFQNGQFELAIEQCRIALKSDPHDQTTLYRLIQALRKTGKTEEIPALLKQLAAVREQATKEERERYRYKLVEPSADQ